MKNSNSKTRCKTRKSKTRKSKTRRKKIDYNSRDGIATTVWGPLAWSLLHIVSVNFPPRPSEDDKDTYFNFVMNMFKVLPCGACRRNIITNLAASNFTREKSMESRETFARAIWRLHNTVNAMTGKPSMSYKPMRDRLELFRAVCTKPSKKKSKSKRKLEGGCTRPRSYVRSKSRIVVVPVSECDEKEDSLQVSARCYREKIKRTKKSKRSRNERQSKKQQRSKSKGQ